MKRQPKTHAWARNFASITLQPFNTNKMLDMQLNTVLKILFGGAIYSSYLKWYRLCWARGFGWFICARMSVPKMKGQQVVICWVLRNVSQAISGSAEVPALQ